MNKKYRILAITYDYYPDNSPNTYRWHNILTEWANEGHEVFVISAQKPGLSSYEIAEGVRVYRTGKSWLEILKSKLPKTVKLEDQSDTANRSLTKESMVKRIYNSTFKKIYFPDFAFLWLSPAKRLAAKLIKEHGINNLITVSWPFTDHLIGYQLQKQHKLNWIADTIDPFYLSDAVNNKFLYKKANRSIENKVLSKASSITVLTHKLKKKYIELYPSLKDKIFVNHNIFIPYPIKKCTNQDSNKIKLVFFGTLIPETRSPITLLKMMDLIDRAENTSMIELHIYGDTTQCDAEFEMYNHLIGRRVYIHGLISKEQVKDNSATADILVNIGNLNEYQEPSKIIEYVYLNKPILNICSIVNDSSKELLDKYHLNFNFYKEDLTIESRKEDLFDFIFHSHDDSFKQTDEGLLANYLLPEVQSRYLKLLEDNTQ